MQNLHFKLTSKYPQYNNWHQTKHHNTIHWGVLVVFTLLVFGTISRWTPITFAADTVPPTTPTNLTVVAISSSQINLSWTASEDDVGVTGYNIYRCAGSACAPTAQIATSATNFYSDTGLTASTAYTYAVSAVDAAGNESGKSTNVNVPTQNQQATGFAEPPYIPLIKPTPVVTKTICANGCDYTTLEQADQAAQPGWLIRIKAGIYDSTKWDSSGVSGNEIVIEPFDDGMVYIETNQGADFNIFGNYIIFDGGANKQITLRKKSGAIRVSSLIRLRGDYQTISRVNVLGPTGICDLTDNAGIRTNTTVSGDNITNKNWKPSNFRIYNNIIDSADHKGIYVGSAKNGEIKNNIIRNTRGTGLQVNPNDLGLGVDGLIISGNAVYGNGYCVDLPGHNIYIQGTASGGGVKDIVISNNLIWGSNRAGIRIFSSVLQNYFKIYNNVFYNNNEYGISTDNNTINNIITYRNNIAYNNLPGQTDFRVSYTSSNNLIANPSFLSTDSTSPDFLKLSSNSTNAIDQGYDLSSEGISVDYFGNSRLQGAGYDIGAYEYGGTPPSDTTPPSTPANLTAIPISPSQINLSWTDSKDDVGVAGYKIYRCAGSACAPTTQIAISTTNSYSNTGLTASTAYTYAVSAYDAAGNESGKSAIASAVTPSPPIQYKPSDLNQDTKVDQQDFDILKQDFNRTDKPKSDLNQDGIVDSRDLGIMMSEWTR